MARGLHAPRVPDAPGAEVLDRIPELRAKASHPREGPHESHEKNGLGWPLFHVPGCLWQDRLGPGPRPARRRDRLSAAASAQRPAALGLLNREGREADVTQAEAVAASPVASTIIAASHLQKTKNRREVRGH